MTSTSYLLRCYCNNSANPILVGAYPTLTDAQTKMGMCVTERTTEGQAAYPTATFDTVSTIDGRSSCVRMTNTGSSFVVIEGVQYPEVVMSVSSQTYYAFLIISQLTNA